MKLTFKVVKIEGSDFVYSDEMGKLWIEKKDMKGRMVCTAYPPAVIEGNLIEKRYIEVYEKSSIRLIIYDMKDAAIGEKPWF